LEDNVENGNDACIPFSTAQEFLKALINGINNKYNHGTRNNENESQPKNDEKGNF
jgi:hypothetical protein